MQDREIARVDERTRANARDDSETPFRLQMHKFNETRLLYG